MFKYLTYIFLVLILTNSTHTYSQSTPVCKMFFCSCCNNSGNGASYSVYDATTDTLIGGFVMDESGCNLDNPVNIVSGQVCYVVTSCGKVALGTIVYFTGCICENGADTVKLPCCPDDDIKSELNNPNKNTPEGFKLLQNYPNPFNPVTNIKFEIPYDSYVKLQIYDIQGNLVQELLNKFLKTGYHEVIWNAEKFASGVYFYKLESDKFKDEKKMVLLK